MKINRGDIWYADLSPAVGSEQAGVRPVVIIQNEKGNRFAPTVIVAAVTSQNKKKIYLHMCGWTKIQVLQKLLWCWQSRFGLFPSIDYWKEWVLYQHKKCRRLAVPYV